MVRVIFSEMLRAWLSPLLERKVDSDPTFPGMIHLRRAIFGVVMLALVLTSGTAFSQASISSPDEVVWHWFGDCRNGKTMGAEVILGGKRIYATSFSICPMRRTQIEAEKRILEFYFEVPARIFGEEFKAIGTQRIEGNIWEAGSERDAIVLGVSFSTRDRVLLNTLHFAYADRASEAELAKALVIKTILKKNLKTH